MVIKTKIKIMKIEMFKVVACVEALNALKEINEMPFELGWQIDDLQEALKKHYDRFNSEKDTIVRKIGVANKDDPTQFEIPKKDIDFLNEEINKLAMFEINLNGVKLLSKVELLDAKLKVNEAANIGALKPFIKTE